MKFMFIMNAFVRQESDSKSFKITAILAQTLYLDSITDKLVDVNAFRNANATIHWLGWIIQLVLVNAHFNNPA